MPDGRTECLAESVRTAVATPDPVQALGLIARAVAAVGPWDSAAIAVLASHGALEPLAWSHSSARTVQHRQQEVGQGPSHDAVTGRCVLAVEDLTTDLRWPLWAPGARDNGIGAAVAVPLFTAAMLGVVTFYRSTSRDWRADDLRRADVAGAQVSVVVAHTATQRNLRRAIESRTVIGQAQGMLVERHGLDPPQAFALLRRYSQDRNVKLAALARQLVTTGTLDELATTRSTVPVPRSRMGQHPDGS